MAKRNPPKLRKDLSRSEGVGYFLRLMERKKDKRLALSMARCAVEPRIYRDVIPRLMSNPMYRWAAVGDPFPATPSNIQKRIQLQHADICREFMWSSEIIGLWREKLRSFVKERVSYESSFLKGDYVSAKTSLDDIQAAFGWSIWLISSRIQLLALSEGLQAQKKFLEELLSQDVSPLLGWVSYYCSLRSEENYSIISINEIIDGLRGSGSIFDYATYSLNPYLITQIEDAKSLLSWQELHPLIDRLHAHVVASRLYLSGEIDAGSRACIIESLELIRSIEDPEIESLLGKAIDVRQNACLDSYSAGKYDLVMADNGASPELLALASLQGGSAEELSAESVVGQIAKCMTEMLLPTDSYVRSRLHLQKLALICGHLPVTRQIASFISRTDGRNLGEVIISSSQPYSAFGRSVADLALPTYAEEVGVERMGRILPDNFESLSEKVASALIAGDVSALPDELHPMQREMHLSQIYLSKGLIEESDAAFKRLAASGGDYLLCCSRVGRFRCALARGDIVSAAEIAVDHCLQAPDIFRLYPMSDLVQRISLETMGIDPISKAILLHLSAKTDSKWGGELSDSYENVLTAHGCERPTELCNFGGTGREIYFLRYICTPGVMEDSTAFDSVEEVESERISICQRLMEMDSSNSKEYSEEIKTITREQNVSNLLNHVQSNMIYVDTSGISSVVKDSLKESFDRYQLLLSSPVLEYQAEQIEKMLKEALSKMRDTEARDLTAPAASERISLFEQMRNHFIDVFALNHAFGLDTNLSTSIRHGVIEGHIRAPFAEEQLLSNFDSVSSMWVIPDYWRDRLYFCSSAERAEIDKAFSRFSSRISDFVKLYRDDLLHIRRIDSKRNGLFYFKAPSQDEIRTLADSITTSTSYEEFLSLMFDHAWTLVDRSLGEIKTKVRVDLGSGLNAAIEKFSTSLNEITAARNAGILNSLARSKVAMHAKIDEIYNWFKRPADISETPFEVETALLVALKQIENCYTGRSLEESHIVETSLKLPGVQLNGFVEVLFLLLQNAIKHGGFYASGRQTPIDIEIREALGSISLRFRNDISLDADLCVLRTNAEAALAKHSEDLDLSMARSEGRSGLSKLKRILKFDLRRDYRIEFAIEDDERAFVATLQILTGEVAENADLCG
ncbi:hypothetical protein SAMN04487782_2845 [Stenotrophomonas maltophilia]|nr:hypothetical protein SAMN04487782_2845 [Stenotrophomonas maltophilia]